MVGIVKALVHDDGGAQGGAGGEGPCEVEHTAEEGVVHVFVLLVGMFVLVKVECQPTTGLVHLWRGKGGVMRSRESVVRHWMTWYVIAELLGHTWTHHSAPARLLDTWCSGWMMVL